MDFKRVMRLFLPIFIEQFLAVLVGVISTQMVSGVSEAAVAGVGMVSNINFVFINVFIAVATGTTVVAAQCFGRRDAKSAREASAHSLTLVLYISVALAAAMFVFRRPIIELLFAGTEQAALDAADIYMLFSAISLPFLAVSSTISGIMRATGEMKLPMAGGVLSNVVNVLVTAVCIHGIGMGVGGAGWGLLMSRIAPMVFLFLILQRGHGAVSNLDLSFAVKFSILAPVLAVAVPAAIDSTIFNGCKLAVQVFMREMGTDTLASYAILNNLSSFVNLAGGALGTLAVSMVGNAWGAGDTKLAHRLTWRLTLIGCAFTALSGLIVFLSLNPLIAAFNASATSEVMIYNNMLIFIIAAPFIWSQSFLIPNCMRAIGRARYTMGVSIASMFACRVFASWLLGVHFGLGLYGIWIGMIIDWVARGICFSLPMIKEPKMRG